jgi:Mg2+/Co2+ transporter CorB
MIAVVMPEGLAVSDPDRVSNVHWAVIVLVICLCVGSHLALLILTEGWE